LLKVTQIDRLSTFIFPLSYASTMWLALHIHRKYYDVVHRTQHSLDMSETPGTHTQGQAFFFPWRQFSARLHIVSPEKEVIDCQRPFSKLFRRLHGIEDAFSASDLVPISRSRSFKIPVSCRSSDEDPSVQRGLLMAITA
jgi:hypothetical protein